MRPTTTRRLPTFLLALLLTLPLAAGSLALPTPGALAAPKSVFNWGANNVGQLGDGTTLDRALPKQPTLPSGLTPISVAAGGDHSLAVASSGNIYAWGANGFGQLGDGTTVERYTPVLVNLPTGVTVQAVAAGFYYSVALTSTGRVYAWGSNGRGELGEGTTAARSTSPVLVGLPDSVTIVRVLAGINYVFAMAIDGAIYSWGANDYGKLLVVRHRRFEG